MRCRRGTPLAWTSVLLAVLSAAGFAASLRYHVTVRHPNTWRIEVSGGAARINWDTGPRTAPSGPTQFDAGAHSTPIEWWPRTYRRVGWPGIILPLWAPAAALGLLGATLWLSARRRPPHAGCPGCGYDLRGLPPTGVCPECGHARRRGAAGSRLYHAGR